jgi:hypothetical protein
MAGRRRLSPLPRRAAVALVAGVLLAHVAALLWVQRLQVQSTLLQPLAEPLVTRVLQPTEPAPPPPPVAAPRPPSRPTARLAPPPAAPAARAPEPVASAPQPEPPADTAEPAVAQAPLPEVPASAPAVAEAPAATPPQAAASAAAPPGEALADSWPADTRLRYRLEGRFRGEVTGHARVLWQRAGTAYQVRVEIHLPLLAVVSMTSQGEVGATLQPRVYEEVTDTVRTRRRGLQLGERTLVFENGGTAPRPEGVQDTASQFVELAHRFSSGREALAVGRPVQLWMARPNQLALWTYDVVGRGPLATGLGTVEAFHLMPRPIANPRGTITAQMWFAPSLQYLPVRIKVTMGEEAELDLVVESIEQK